MIGSERAIRFSTPQAPLRERCYCTLTVVLVCGATWTVQAESTLDLVGVTVTPHVVAPSMRYLRPPEPAAGARVQLYLRHPEKPEARSLSIDSRSRLLFDGKSPAELLRARAWTWHDTPAAVPVETLSLPAGAMTVWTFNGRVAPFGPGGRIPIELGPEGKPWLSTTVALAAPSCWLSAVTFLASDNAIQPDRIVVHLANELDSPVTVRSCRLWLPRDPKSPAVLFPQPLLAALDGYNGHSTIPAHERGGFTARTGSLPLTCAAIEVEVLPEGRKAISLWGYLRIKTERFDISGGWVNDRGMQVTHESFLKALKPLYVNTAHLSNTLGYTDTEFYARYPLKYFHALRPFETYDTDAMVPRIHAVEFLGEPQYGGGRPVPPQEVWEKLHPYATTSMPAREVSFDCELIVRESCGATKTRRVADARKASPEGR